MKETFQKGFMSYVAIFILALVVGGGAYYFSDENNTEDFMEGDSEMMMDSDGVSYDDETVIDEDSSMTMEDVSFDGVLIAGDKDRSPLIDFNKTDYDKAVASDKLVVLYFYANWCPVCKAEFPKMQEVFDGLDTDRVVGFRVNYNDNQTDKDEETLARKFGVAYQHTKVFVKDGERILKSPEGWEKSRYIEEINKALK